MNESKSQAEYIKKGQQHAQRLKYLDFLQAAAARAVLFLASLYVFAKENSGPLKYGVRTAERIVMPVAGPAYQRFHHVPFEILKFVDNKVDNTAHKLERHVPTLVNEAWCHAYTAAQKAPDVARSIVSEVQRTGVVATTVGISMAAYEQYSLVAKDLCGRYQPVAERYASWAWRTLNRVPLFPQVAQILVPMAAHCSEKYNRAVGRAAERGHTVAGYLPLVPTERIAKVFGSGANGAPAGSRSGVKEVVE